MYNERRLKLMSVLLAVFWTTAMVWWLGHSDPVRILLMTIGGALVGVCWYFSMRWFSRRYPRPPET
jgi:hypothetical protein